MPVELVMLSDVEPTQDQWVSAATEVVGGGSIARFQGDLRQILSKDARALVAWWPGRLLEGRREAIAALGPAADSATFWIDVVLSPGGEQEGREIAERVASTVGARLMGGGA